MSVATLNRPLRLGTRSSPLAMAQAHEAQARLADALGIAKGDIEIIAVTASGDKILDRPLAEIGGKALWTKELDRALMLDEIDFAVHSAKDVETIRPKEITIAAVLPREDVRDVLIGAKSIADLPHGATVGTSAPRRAAQLLNKRPDCKVVSFRGNVAKRLSRLDEGEADATFLAAAGLIRLGQTEIGHPLDAEDWLPAPGQAAIAIECRTADTRVVELLKTLDHPPSRESLMAERALLAALGGNCHSSIAVLSKPAAGGLHMRAVLFSPDGADRQEGEITVAPGDTQATARLAAQLLAASPTSIREHFTGIEGNTP